MKGERYHYGPDHTWDEFTLGFSDKWEVLAQRLALSAPPELPAAIAAPRLVRDLCQQPEMLSMSLSLPGAADTSDALAIAIIRGLQTEEAQAGDNPVTYQLLQLADSWRRDSREMRPMDQVARDWWPQPSALSSPLAPAIWHVPGALAYRLPYAAGRRVIKRHQPAFSLARLPKY